jgi:hypothetical protein
MSKSSSRLRMDPKKVSEEQKSIYYKEKEMGYTGASG